jgi:predicted metal-dependent phosphotriesterase family hydrolase
VARVNTFGGPVDSGQLGFTLMHEHFFIIELCRRGNADRLVFPEDLVITLDESPAEGFAYILRQAIPALLEAGVTPAQVDRMARDNPRAIFERNDTY